MKKQHRVDREILLHYFANGVLDKVQLKNFAALPLVLTPSEKDDTWSAWMSYVSEYGGKAYNPEHVLFKDCVVLCNNLYCRYHQMDDKSFVVGIPLKSYYVTVTLKMINDQMTIIRIRHKNATTGETVVFERQSLSKLLGRCDGGDAQAIKLIHSLLSIAGVIYDAVHLIYVFNQQQKLLLVEMKSLKDGATPDPLSFGSTVLSMMDLPEDDGSLSKSKSPHWVAGHHKTLRDIRFINHKKFMIQGGIFVPDYYVGQKQKIVDGKQYTVIDLSDKLTELTL